MGEPKLLQCYNKGCSQMFDESANHAEACVHHPGNPFFHDAYKGWSCCNKKCTDFTEFLNIKGCTKSFHNNVKPPEPEKKTVDEATKDDVIEYRAPQPKTEERLSRPSEDTTLVNLPVTISKSLEQYLEKLNMQNLPKESTIGDTNAIPVGTSCKNNGCRKTYENEISNSEICAYHPGSPIFHEGLKYWTCCLKKTMDFNSFLEQVGCTEGKHIWIKKETTQKMTDTRYDWHQTGSYVAISIYTKGTIPDKSCVEVNPIKLKIFIVHSGDYVFEKEIILSEIIDVEKSMVTMSATKVEIKLKKAEPVSWKYLALNKEL